MSKTEEKEIWEFQRKSFIHWRLPFLSDDPPQFVSRDKQRLNNLDEYKLDFQYIFDSDTKWINDGWIYSDHFKSRKWSKNEFSSSHLCRKRCWKRRVKKQFISKISKTVSLSSIINEEKEKEYIIKPIYGSQCEYIIHEIEINQSSKKWKSYQNGWFDQKMKALKIQTPYDIKLENLNNDKNGKWKWCEGWSCIDPDPSLSSNTSSSSALYNNDLVHLQSLRYMNTSTINNDDNDNDIAPDIADEDNIDNMDNNNDDDIAPDIISDDIEDIDNAPDIVDFEEIIKRKEPKKKKKRIRIKKNAKKLFEKMKGNKKDKKIKNRMNLKKSKSEGDILKNVNGKKIEHITILSTDEQIELHELFTNIERGWSYSIKCSKDDNDWKPQNNIISKCHFRRRTWVRCAIYDSFIFYPIKKDKKKEEKEEEEKEEEKAPILSKSDSLAKSIARSKNKANDLIAMIDGVLSGDSMKEIAANDVIRMNLKHIKYH